MRRNNLLRAIIIVTVIVWSLWQLYPTFIVGQQKSQAELYLTAIMQHTGLQRDEINEALNAGQLEGRIRLAMRNNSPDSLQVVLKEATSLIALHDRISKNETKTIKRGLDLQGGTYLVYEVNLPKLVRDVAKNKDARFEELMQELDKTAMMPNVDYFDELQKKFSAADIRLNRYFYSRAQTDAEILANLRKEADDAIDRNLEILRNRIDQFGVSEPTITKQGSRRVVIELAGITDVNRAKNIIGKTALLEFNLVKDPQIFQDVITKIDNLLKSDLAAKQGKTLAAADTARSDTTGTGGKVSKDKEMGVSDLFGSSSIVQTDTTRASKDTVRVDEQMVSENPFLSLLRNYRGEVAVPAQNVRAVERILNNPEVQKLIPPDAEFIWSNKPERQADTEYYLLYLVKKEPELNGALLTDARATIASGAGMTKQGEWVVSFQLNNEGTKTFARVTGANVNKRLGIVLDNKMVMAPNIKEKIPGGSAQIEGSMDANEAKDLAIVLRAGSLQAPMHVIEERTIGPSLGQDSIHKGQLSALVGFCAVVIFMAIYYRLSGLLAILALMLNLIIILSALAFFKATLTLPGVAGIVLTIGMAVDANVLIFERIREELRGGKTVRAAIDTGYQRAFSAIFDSNLTTVLTAIVLYQFGTGPIRGFAITLIIGIIASLFTAIVVTRVIYDYFTSRRQLATLSI
ncbi:MAG: protein translocase subunit SecD [candidate division KSB1 bacterium]|nr:protein translocase subunit SecD [candidate division KSB1 bacterium]MDZ7301303.1 protein translocase subunit SecD [candidate division KSB1 bacterium]MDZ7310812.1 protein translocase subunit SecD [candidate division KSB1 bacterium]